MPEESKKSYDKKKNDSKEQRRPRQRHQQAEKKLEKKADEPKSAPKVTVPQKPVYESPPPEFFKSLKRETDEILKITEEESSKYKKKEIQSNWTKYEMPIESYDDIQAQENMGADYEKLVEAPLSIGGHFQFKHEKSWEVNMGSSVYDKYFNINMEDLNLALCTIPFNERNDTDMSIFTQIDILTMNNRVARFKQKYYNDNSYATPETEVLDIIKNKIRENDKKQDIDEKCTDVEINSKKEIQINENVKHQKIIESDVNLRAEPLLTEISLDPANKDAIEEKLTITTNITENLSDLKENTTKAIQSTSLENINLKIGTKEIVEEAVEEPKVPDITNTEDDKSIFGNTDTKTFEGHEIKFPKVPESTINPVPKATVVSKETKKSLIESPEDLEKWLDDFLDG